MTSRRVHTADFEQDAVQLARTNGNVFSTARDLSVSVSLLRRWRSAEEESGHTAFPNHGQQEIRRLLKRVEILLQEREILKKAAACLGHNSTCMGLAHFFAEELTR